MINESIDETFVSLPLNMPLFPTDRALVFVTGEKRKEESDPEVHG